MVEGSGSVVPTPKRPGSIVAFVALPVLLGLIAMVVVYVITPGGGDRGMRLPANVGDLAAAAANRIGGGNAETRQQAVQELAEWTRRCPGLGPFTVPVLADALKDPSPAVKGAAAIGLGSLGGHGRPALPALRAARGTSMAHFDRLVSEAILFIEAGEMFSGASGCEALSEAEFEQRRARWRGGRQPEPTFSPRPTAEPGESGEFARGLPDPAG